MLKKIQEIQTEITNRVGNAILDLTFVKKGNSITIEGKTDCYYHKQVANVVTMQHFPHVTNHIEVIHAE